MAHSEKVDQKPVPSGGISGYRLFRIFGFEVKLNLTWLLLGLLITWTLAAGLFPNSYPGLAQKTYWWMGVAGAVGILFSIVFHELSHSLVGRYYGLQIRGITLFIFGGVAEMEEEPVSPKVEFLMAVAGPLASILLGIVFFQLESLATAMNWHTSVVAVSHYLGLVNVIVAIFNLVPAFPLDGGRMLRAMLWHWKQNLRTATRLASGGGKIFGIALMVLGALSFLQGAFIAGMWWFLIGIFLHTAAKESYRRLLVHETLSDRPVRQFMKRDPITVPPGLMVDRLLEDYIYPHHYKMFPVVDDSKLLGCVTSDVVKKIPPEKRGETPVSELVATPSDDNSVSPDLPAERLITVMSRPDRSSRYMVVDNGRLVGMISLKDLREFISLKLDLE